MPLPEHVRQIREKIGHAYMLMPAVSVLVFNDAGEILLGQRSDNGKWATIGGIVDPDETPAVTAVREAREECGIEIELERVSGVYSSPTITYPNGDVAQYTTIAFRAVIVRGTPHVADEESLAVQFFPLDRLPADVSENQRVRIEHAQTPGRHLPAVFE
ncbi:MAG: NUDIX domain-containing protein [Tepidisphaeraceae bacterium]